MRRFLFPLLALALLACAPRQVVVTRSRLLMGNVPVNLSLKIRPERKAAALEAGDAAYRLAQSLEEKVSEFRPDSEVSCLNRNAGKAPCPLSPETLDLLKKALAFSEKTGGALDIRFASLSAAGGRGPILLQENPPSGFLVHPETRIGIGALGKGWIVDRMIEDLRSRGFDQALIDAGGDLRASGGPWRVSIQIPGAEPGATAEEREVEDLSLATSGLYERGSHILDPKTRRAVERPGSVSVESEDLTTADALDTALFVIGEEKSKALIEKFTGLRVIWLDPDGKSRHYQSPPFEKGGAGGI
ncbi:MAG TPA: FAD:protein FMN transferase [bacterium]|nr:FAD:protein FMN transferase [bacterium]